jgi:hypothetical protein
MFQQLNLRGFTCAVTAFKRDKTAHRTDNSRLLAGSRERLLRR